jgi:hypothetical protein
MKYAAAIAALGLVVSALPAAGQEVVVPEVSYYAPSVPVTTYYAPAVPVTSYYYSAWPATTYYSTYYAPAVVGYYPAPYYYVPPRVARRWWRNGYYW